MEIIPDENGMNSLLFLSDAPKCHQVQNMINKFNDFVDEMCFSDYSPFDKDVAVRMRKRVQVFQEFFIDKKQDNIVFGSREKRRPVERDEINNFKKKKRI